MGGGRLGTVLCFLTFHWKDALMRRRRVKLDGAIQQAMNRGHDGLAMRMGRVMVKE